MFCLDLAVEVIVREVEAVQRRRGRERERELTSSITTELPLITCSTYTLVRHIQ